MVNTDAAREHPLVGWLAATLVVLGYFATLGIGPMQHGVGVSK